MKRRTAHQFEYEFNEIVSPELVMLQKVVFSEIGHAFRPESVDVRSDLLRFYVGVTSELQNLAFFQCSLSIDVVERHLP